jgi:ribosomal protein L10
VRFQVVALTKVKRKTKAEKAALVEALQDAAGTYAFVYLFEIENMKNEALKSVRAHWHGKGRYVNNIVCCGNVKPLRVL